MLGGCNCLVSLILSDNNYNNFNEFLIRMLRKDSSFREISVSDSLEHKSFLNLARKPSSKLAFHQAAKMLDSNKENTARTYSESTKDFFFKKDIK